MSEFSVGDIVYLKSGGPPMCVEEMFEHAGTARVVWIASDGQPHEVYYSQALMSKTVPSYWWPLPNFSTNIPAPQLPQGTHYFTR